MIALRVVPSLLIEAPTKEKSTVPVYNFTVEDDHSYFVGTAQGGVWVHNCPADPLKGDPFPYLELQKQYRHVLGTPESRMPQFAGRTMFDPAYLQSVGKTVVQVMEDAWNNAKPGNLAQGQYIGEPGYPVTAAGDLHVDFRVGNGGVHGWPIP